ncbi:MAG: DoxX-like family protein [Deltaproteobacteria bacterium]|nr:DoxX-like family protein [Deltaproteobacteria bacterium]
MGKLLRAASPFLMAIFYTLAGVNHFAKPTFYLPMMPPFLPKPELLIAVSGVAEIALGLGMFWKRSRRLAAFGIIALLIAVFPANVYMLYTAGRGYDFPYWGLVARLPLQFLLIYWAWTQTRLTVTRYG